MRTDRLLTCVLVLCVLAGHASARELRVCADPNNLPFSNDKREGFENEIVEIIADELKAQVKYTWWAQRRGYVRNGLKAGACDLIPGVSADMEMLATTRPYYRSTYVFVVRTEDELDVSSLDDERLKSLIVGVQLIGDDFSNTPPAHALSRRGIIDNVRGFPLYGNYGEANPPRAIVDAVGEGRIDVALVWGPLAGYFAETQKQPLELRPVAQEIDGAFPMTYAVAMGVRREDEEFRRELNAALERRRHDIERVLDRYHVPRLHLPDHASTAER